LLYIHWDVCTFSCHDWSLVGSATVSRVLQKICMLGYCNLMGRKVSYFISLLAPIARFILEMRTQIGYYNDMCHLQEVSAGRN
jgi:hypothetical protein